ncbi:Transcriptional regulatory protein DpiA [Vibrio aerogenes CECT 7868]|uniref:Transcriptional regulatory protein n=1 Tax=Vibrio aerogenes CECT 7868 TaxID=1216006 RepID=A0A1M5X3R7_9VIBR|nr:response regulator [Vibrio aerogenes]SHH94459.1 Transcriptional regulatory protein DpiA [Vibrio aerogenes CECT 7868]
MSNKIRTLVVEDKLELAQMVGAYIEKNACYELVGIASNLADARFMHNTLRPELIILDNYLPDGSGIDWLRRLRSEQSQNVDVIMMTAAADAQTVTSGIRLGAFDYLIKPLALTSFNDVLHRFRDYHRTISSKTKFKQSEINRVYGVRRDPKVIDELPKNIDPITLQRVMGEFENNQPQTSDSVGKQIGVSKTTARRYLEYAVTMGFLEANINHGSIGRPTRQYTRNMKEYNEPQAQR